MASLRNKEKSHLDLLVTDGISTKKDRDIQVYSDLKLKPKNHSQASYMQTINDNILTFGIGPAGTGKSYLAVSMAAEAFRNGQTRSIHIVRMAVESGPKMGSLPGTVDEKMDPYFDSIKEILFETIGRQETLGAIKAGIIRLRALNYMRGSTINDGWVILDEAQNTKPSEMKMFLTRLGENVKVIVNGDIDQIDITGPSGLTDALGRLTDVDNIGIHEFGIDDCVRSELVKSILKRY